MRTYYLNCNQAANKNYNGRSHLKETGHFSLIFTGHNFYNIKDINQSP